MLVNSWLNDRGVADDTVFSPSYAFEVEKPTKKEGSRDLLILESPKRKNLKNAVLSDWSPLPHQTVIIQSLEQFEQDNRRKSPEYHTVYCLYSLTIFVTII